MKITTYTYAVGTTTTIRCDEGAERVELVRVTARGRSPARGSSETEDHFLRAMFESHSRSLP